MCIDGLAKCEQSHQTLSMVVNAQLSLSLRLGGQDIKPSKNRGRLPGIANLTMLAGATSISCPGRHNPVSRPSDS